ncbi:MAG: sugar kinase [Betaproteobacteria bacterium]|nr:sugar kinase [Betaproteobacteria bacterium]
MSGRIVCFGELLLRLNAPGRELLLQSGVLQVHVGGAEANVAIGLSSLGRDCAMVSAVPDNALGRGAVAALRARGVDCAGVRTLPGRMGLYFMTTGAGSRASEIVYDRTASSFARAKSGDFDWDALLHGAALFHLSGIVPALGPASVEVARQAVRAARALGVPVSFDGNYRAQLWSAWDSTPAPILRDLIDHADLLFGNHRDLSLVLGRSFGGEGESRRREAADAAFAAFPRLKLMASTARDIEDADCHRIAARVDLRDGFAQTPAVRVTGIVDRIGAGDAFAAGVLHAWLKGGTADELARTGLALTCLKHTLPGDASVFREADIAAFHEGGLDVRR